MKLSSKQLKEELRKVDAEFTEFERLYPWAYCDSKGKLNTMYYGKDNETIWIKRNFFYRRIKNLKININQAEMREMNERIKKKVST